MCYLYEQLQGVETFCVITFHWYGRNYFPIVKARLEIHQAREILAWLERSIEIKKQSVSVPYQQVDRP